jgi:hypothetical protein
MRVVGAALVAAGLLVVPLVSAATFGRPAEIPLARAPTAVVDVDATQDGTEDLVVANSTGPTLTVLPGKPDGSFDKPLDVGTGPAPGALAVADLDGDGDDDVAVAGGGQIAIYGGAEGSLVRRATLTAPSSSTILATDLDLDGNYDLVSASSTRAVMTVFLGTGEGTFLARREFATNGPTRALFSADLNGDELPDVATGGNGIGVSLGHGDGTLGPSETVAGSPGVTALTGGDLDGNGSVDLAETLPPNAVYVVKNAGDGHFLSGSLYRVGAKPSAIGVSFVDPDSELDLVTANRGTNDVSILRGLGDGQFGAEERVKTGKAPVALAIEDLDTDGVNDLATANRLSRSVTLLLNGADAPQPVVCLVPRVARRTLAVARRLVAAAHCKVASARRKYSGRVKKGRVISIRPIPGTRRPVDATVTLLVSRGRKPKR